MTIKALFKACYSSSPWKASFPSSYVYLGVFRMHFHQFHIRTARMLPIDLSQIDKLRCHPRQKRTNQDHHHPPGRRSHKLPYYDFVRMEIYISYREAHRLDH